MVNFWVFYNSAIFVWGCTCIVLFLALLIKLLYQQCKAKTYNKILLIVFIFFAYSIVYLAWVKSNHERYDLDTMVGIYFNWSVLSDKELAWVFANVILFRLQYAIKGSADVLFTFAYINSYYKLRALFENE